MKEQVFAIIAEVLNICVERVSPDLGIGEIPEWSSMAQMNLIATLENRLEIEFPIEDLFELTTVQAILHEVEKIKSV